MKFLVDNALSPAVADGLRKAGHEAKHVRDWNMEAAPDPAVLELAAQEDRILISADRFRNTADAADTDQTVGDLAAPSVSATPEQQTALLLANLPNVASALEQGCIVVIEERRIRIRPLPIGGADSQ